jgi:heme exporter protein C
MHRFANPARFMRMARIAQPIAWLLALGCIGAGMGLVWFVTPEDYQQGDTVRIMYLHVPAAMFGMGIYAMIAILSVSFLIWRHTLAAVAAREAAPIGAVFTVICLITGALWGKPMWGAYWVWDARLTSMLVLFLIYIGYIALASAHDDESRGYHACAWLAVIGSINLPIIKFSVEWWNTLHQPASLFRLDGPTIHASMLSPLLLMVVGFAALALAVLLMRIEAALNMQKLRRLQMQSIAAKSAHHKPGETLEI